MSKTKTVPETDTAAEIPAPTLPTFDVKVTSIDETHGTVVCSTDAPDGVEFTANIDGSEVKATAAGGQLWFYASRSLSEAAMVRLL
ncbi:hypothetical protein [Spirosoma sp.]|uniref:hypothetical protein n=1 Tax=Spirosoma sp. TaxID=1899569 RepID=UPI002634BD6A|nr:hypothetical protein [Spirosoma sp.]MCX6217608.1 hypothetical protein [Spirosoma sp.]